MAKNLGAAIIQLLDHERVDLRAAAATVLGSVGKGDPQVAAALAARLDDPDGVVRRIALEGLAAMGTGGLAPRLVTLLHGDDATLAERAAQLLAGQGAAAEGALKAQLGHGSVQVRRAIAGLLIQRGSKGALAPVVAQLGDGELGEQVLQLLRAEIDREGGKLGELGELVDELALARAGEVGKALDLAWRRALAAHAKASQPVKGKGKGKGKAKAAPVVAAPVAAPEADPEVATLVRELGLVLRLVGYLARPTALPLLLRQAGDDRPRAIRLAAIAALRRLVAASEARGTEKAIELLIELADGADLAVAQAAIDTLRGARVPDELARPFAALARSKNSAAQKLAMERLPAGGGSGALKALIDALGGADITARDAAARGLGKAPEAVLPLARALCATEDPEVARRFAGALRHHREHVSSTALEELVDHAHRRLELHAKGKAPADSILIERILLETLADVSPTRHVELLFEYARRLRKSGKPAEAFGALKPLLRGHADLDNALADDQRFQLAVLGLEALGQGILRASGADTPVLAQFARLAQRGYPVARKLAREKDVGDADVYALGFRLLESKEGMDQELGAELMQGLIDERPRSKLAKNARNKLSLAGYEA